MDVMEQVVRERAELADLLDTLTPEQWEAPSLCAQWRVRDVVAHVVSYDGLRLRGLVSRAARGRLLLDRMNAVGVADHAGLEPGALVGLLRDHVRPSGIPAGFGGRIALTDGVVHQQDIRRPLGLPRQVPAERLRRALRFALVAPPIRGLWHARGVRLVATDLDWAYGRGPEVHGPGEAVLMVLAGRRGIAAELTGPGQPVLARRLG